MDKLAHALYALRLSQPLIKEAISAKALKNLSKPDLKSVVSKTRKNLYDSVKAVKPTQKKEKALERALAELHERPLSSFPPPRPKKPHTLVPPKQGPGERFTDVLD